MRPHVKFKKISSFAPLLAHFVYFMPSCLLCKISILPARKAKHKVLPFHNLHTLVESNQHICKMAKMVDPSEHKIECKIHGFITK